MHVDAPLSLAVSTGQGRHTEAPVELENVPASQGVHVGAPGRALYVPAAQGAQVLLAAGEAPAGQRAQGLPCVLQPG